jgi:hypothetical protein
MHAEDFGMGSVSVVVPESASSAASTWIVWYSVPRSAILRLHAYLRHALGEVEDDGDNDDDGNDDDGNGDGGAGEDGGGGDEDEGVAPGSNPRGCGVGVVDSSGRSTSRSQHDSDLRGRYSLTCMDDRQLWADPAGIAAWNSKRRQSDRVIVHRHVQSPGEYFVADYGAVRWGISLGVCWLVSTPYAFPEWREAARETDRNYRRLESASGCERRATCVPNFSTWDAELLSIDSLLRVESPEEERVEVEKKRVGVGNTQVGERVSDEQASEEGEKDHGPVAGAAAAAAAAAAAVVVAAATAAATAATTAAATCPAATSRAAVTAVAVGAEVAADVVEVAAVVVDDVKGGARTEAKARRRAAPGPTPEPAPGSTQQCRVVVSAKIKLGAEAGAVDRTGAAMLSGSVEGGGARAVHPSQSQTVAVPPGQSETTEVPPGQSHSAAIPLGQSETAMVYGSVKSRTSKDSSNKKRREARDADARCAAVAAAAAVAVAPDSHWTRGARAVPRSQSQTAAAPPGQPGTAAVPPGQSEATAGAGAATAPTLTATDENAGEHVGRCTHGHGGADGKGDANMDIDVDLNLDPNLDPNIDPNIAPIFDPTFEVDEDVDTSDQVDVAADVDMATEAATYADIDVSDHEVQETKEGDTCVVVSTRIDDGLVDGMEVSVEASISCMEDSLDPEPGPGRGPELDDLVQKNEVDEVEHRT